MINTKCTTADLGDFESTVLETLNAFQQQNLPERLWAQDPSLWKSDPAVQAKIQNRLGWLGLVEVMPQMIETLESFAQSIKEEGFKDVFLLGMGGSSLCPEVLKQTFASATAYPTLTVLDTTDPEAILSAEKNVDLKSTLFILASKSGSTIEMLSLYRYFAKKVQTFSGDNIGKQFIAITDPGSPLEKLANEQKFRNVFSTPADVGGRYSALTCFGLVPAALLGIDLLAFSRMAKEMVVNCGNSVPCEKNPAILLGVILGKLSEADRDKLTFIPSQSLSHFGIWAEQLIAESTGKEGKGVIPIDREVLGEATVYGNDRVFVYLRLETDDCNRLDQKISELKKAGHPVVQIDLKSCEGLAGEFFRWEMATAVAGIVLGVNPFDEPNVSESKKNTAAVLTKFEKTGELALPPALSFDGEIDLSGDLNVDASQSLAETLQTFFSREKQNPYVAIMAYLAPSKKHDTLLQKIRMKIRDTYQVATTLGYGPRFLHSTGQLHKGGKRSGLFLQITVTDEIKLDIPGESYRFDILKRAQALGDFHSLVRHRLPVLDIRLSKNIETGLEKIIQAL